MNTIIVQERDIRAVAKKYDKCSAPFLFDNFNLTVLLTNGKKINYEVRTKNKGIVIRIDNAFFYGVITDITPEEAFPNNSVRVAVDKSNGDVEIGQLYIPADMNNPKNFEKAIQSLYYDYPMFRDMLQSVSNVMVCIMMMGEERKKIYREKTNAVARESRNNYKDSETKKSVFLLEDIVQYIANNNVSSKHNIQCPCWEVRGHYRHYKSGKVVFVKSFKKGKKRNEEEPKSKNYYM